MAAIARTATEKLAHLRRLMGRHNWAAYVVPSSDAHISEYIPARDARREFISGFTGSAGTAVVTTREAKLWTDGRYFLQAEKQLDTSAGWALMKAGLPETPSIESWLASSLNAGDTVGVDATVMPLATVNRMAAALEPKGIKLDTSQRANLVDEVWGAEQPAAPASPVMPLPLRYTGASAADKIAKVQAALAKEGASALVVTALDEVAWLLNIRGADIECNPVTVAYAVVLTPEAAAAGRAAAGAAGADAAAAAAAPLGEATLFIDGAKLGADAREHLAASVLPSGSSVEVRPYGDIWASLPALPGKVWLDPSFANYAVYQAVAGRSKGSGEAAAPAAAGGGGAGAAGSAPAPAAGSAPASVHQAMSPLQLLKAVKNATEAAGMRAAHVRDAAALVSFFAWLEAAVKTGVDIRTGAPLAGPPTEASAAAVLEGFRAAQPDFVGLSFPTIAGMGANGAIIHYRPEEATAAAITDSAVFLCDSGGQYRDGTTDVTRTLHFGAPTAHERRCYTRVLQGHIGLASAVFPTGASGMALDAFARAPLWRDGLEYRHGTGHGVGAFLNVHEGPFGISPQQRTSYEGGAQAFLCMSNEPGYYEDGAFGVRIENVVLFVPAATPHRFGGKEYLACENLTMVPMCRALTDASLLSPQERAYLDAYHAQVRAAVAPLLAGNDAALAFLMRETEPL